MFSRFLSVQIRRKFRKLIEKYPLLRKLSVLIYKANGRKPWSLGYSIHKYDVIKEVIKGHLDFFTRKKLPTNFGFAIDERVVEYPWFFSRIRNDENVLLDAGATLNHLEILTLPILKDRELFIATLHPEGEYRNGISPAYVYEDLRRTSFCDEKFDAIACLSTLEHIGMDNSYFYAPDGDKKENNKYAFLDAIKEFRRVLKKGGRLFLSMPYGKYKHHQWLQVFDDEMVAKIKELFSPVEVEESYFKYENDQWDFANADACKESHFFDIHNGKEFQKDYLAASQSVVCLVLSK